MSSIETILLGAVGTLSTCVGYMFLEFQRSTNEIKAALKDCQEDREELWKRLAGIEDVQAHQNKT